MVQVASKRLRFLITAIHVTGDRICVASHTDSISFYHFDPDSGKIEFRKSDTVSRTIRHTMLLNGGMAVGSCMSGGLVGLYDDPDDKSFEHRLQRLFSFHYPDLLTQPMLSTLSAQRYTGSERKLLRKHLLPWTAITEKDIQKASEEPLLPIVCCSLAGGVIQIHRLDASLYALLLALQERLIASEVPLLLGSSKDFKEWYCQLSHGETNTIHGDLLVSFFRLSASEQNQLLSAKDDSIDLIEAVRTFLATMGPEGELVKPLGDFESWATVPMTVADAITVYEKIILELENNT
ncbi:uncharacterized protein BYT42DRAFT_305854 [Radiomyces spectabilis]|uniref:uncharacterized protein n=1 Tax=Radiomyces spectabilis TaxID=64574 RepID=UPI00221F4CD1|nr:uncharacterized protein BYT42DRAFT_305854 [Radiomyces spectabilis]KAI8381453.1 hypothetical protein BYT42DRAFT_305854 [Radiomyces spectabilis]